MSWRRFSVFALVLLAPLSLRAEGLLPEPSRVELDNGMTFLLVEKNDVPLIGFEAVIQGGAVSDPEGMAGMADLVAGLMQKGAGDRSALEYAEAIAAVGGELYASAQLENISVSGEFMARDAELMVSLLADLLIRPTLSAEETVKLRDRSINVIRAAKDSNLNRIVSLYATAYLFGDHPYARPVGGSEASLARIRHRDVTRYYRSMVGPDRTFIVVVGDFDTAEMASLLTAAFADWAPVGGEVETVAAPEPVPGGRVLLIDKPGSSQTYFVLSKTGVAVDYPWRAELNVANTLFGGRFTSMLNTALRVESGLTYGARSRLLRPSRSGSVSISSYTATETTIEAIDMALDVLSALHTDGIDDDMLVSAQNYIQGQFAPGFETAAQQASALATLEHYGLALSHYNGYGEAIAATTVESVNDVIAGVYPTVDELTFVVLGDAETIRDDIAQYGEVVEVSITEPDFQIAE